MEAWLIIENFLDGDGYRAFELYRSVAYTNKDEAVNKVNQLIAEEEEFLGFSCMIANKNTYFASNPIDFTDVFWADPNTVQHLGDVEQYDRCLTLRKIIVC